MQTKIRTFLVAASCMAALGLPPAQAQDSGAYLAGRQASFSGDFKAAAEYYGQSILSDPSRPELLERTILALLSLGDVARADRLAQRLEDAGHRSQLAHMARGAVLAADGDYAGLMARIRDGRSVSPLVDGLITAWSHLGTGDMSAALVAFDEAAGTPGMQSFAAYHKGLSLASVGDFEGADTILASDNAAALRLTRRGVMAHAEVLSQLGRNEEALQLLADSFDQSLDPGLSELKTRLENGDTVPFSQIGSPKDGIAEVFYSVAAAISNEADDDVTLLYSRIAEHIQPEHIDTVLLSAALLQSLNQHELAAREYRKVPRDHPAFHAAELGRAESLQDLDRPDAAIEVLENLTLSHGTLPIVHATLGDARRNMDDYAGAIDAYTQALSLSEEPSRQDWFLLYARGISYERLGAWDKAEADFRRALELNPDQPNVLNYLGYSLVEKQIKLEEALDMIQRAVDARPRSGFIVDSLGWALFRLGRYEEAVEHMERATELMAVDPVVNDHLGDVYWAVGRELEARFQWKRALSFIDYGSSAEEVDPDRIRRKLEVGLDTVLEEEGAPPLRLANDEAE